LTIYHPGNLLFDDATGRQIDLDLSEPAQRGRGRLKMGVQAREVTLLRAICDHGLALAGPAFN